jgi:hypothetical protein
MACPYADSFTASVAEVHIISALPGLGFRIIYI